MAESEIGRSGRLYGRVALVTGSTGGLGKAIVHRLAAEGARVVVTDVDGAACTHLAATLPTHEGPHLSSTLDVRNDEQWATVVDRTFEEYRGLHVLVNNAGVGSLATVEGEYRKRWDTVVDTNQLGVWLGMKYGGALIERSGGGAIVNVCSILGTVGGFGDSFAYQAAKGAVRSMSKNAALHWADRGVRVNSLHPAFVETQQLTDNFGGTERYRAMVDYTPMGRLGRPDEIAGAVAFLTGNDATFITGSELYVDGGWTAR